MTATETVSEEIKQKIFYFSRLSLTDEYFQNIYRLHQAVWSLFPGMEGATRPFLFRGVSETGQMLVQSSVEPEIPEWDGIKLQEVNPFHFSFREGMRYRFKLDANPIRRKARKRFFIENEDERKEWLKRVMADAAEITDIHEKKAENVYFTRKKRTGHFVRSSFHGTINVTDAEKLTTLATSGIGAEKSMGCGLLVLSADKRNV